MITHRHFNPRRGFAFPRFFIAAALILTGAVMAVYAASPRSEEAAATPQKGKGAVANNIYIVQMRLAPVATYKGEVPGLKATAPAQGQKINQKDPKVNAYASHLRTQHDAVLSRVGGEKVYSYVYTLNGFAAKLTSKQAEAMRADPDVISVEKDEAMKLDTSTTPRFLGLSAPGGLWDQLGGGSNQSNGPGENMVVGMVDTGIWPEHPSFSNRNEQGTVVYTPLVGFTGSCQATSPDNSWDATYCNNKIVAARKYNAGHGGDAGILTKYPWEFLSPRDYGGHGSHTSSTAGGNNGVQPTGDTAVLGPISGMAPRARIAVYKVCWTTKDPNVGGCFTSDSVAAIDQATADGVNGINFSISGTTTSFSNTVEVAFRNAAQAGVFVSASAGNSGPTISTVAHPSPWVMTVANSTHDRSGVGSVTLGNGATYTGASFASALSSKPLVDSVNVGLPGADPVKVELCYSAADNGGTAVLDPAKVQGKIVLCKRGVIALVNKSAAVKAAGGAGAVIYNDPAGATNTLALFHAVPTVHVLAADGLAIKNYIAAQGAAATASIAQATIVSNLPAPLISSSSSRGPSAAAGGDLLKPDVTAPGSDILAAVAPPNNANQLFALYSGTSMSAPHVLGVGMLLKQQHPTWSPMMIKSALMTTGTNVIDTGITEATRIFRQGAGHITPNNATNPGLVFDSNINDWNAFLCATGFPVTGGQTTCNGLLAAGYSSNPSDLNMASIAIGDLVGSETVKRTVTNVSNSSVTYTASVTNPPGVNVTVNPSSLTLGPGQTASFNVTFSRTNAAFGTYTGGQLTWTGGGFTVRIPLVVRPLVLAVATEAASSGSPMNIPVRFGYDGPFNAFPRGMVPAILNQGTVSDDPADTFTPGGPGTTSFDVVVPAGTTYARFALFDANTDKPGLHDLDLYVYRVSTNTLVASTGGATSNEEANLLNPAADTYRVWVHGYNTSGPTASFTLFSWVLGNTAARNMFVLAPWSATTGGSANINVRFSNLAPNTKYLGSIAYSGVTGLPNPTIVRVDTPAQMAPASAEFVSVASSRTPGELVFPAGSLAVESRRGANYDAATGTADYTIIFGFSMPISSGSATITGGTGTISSQSVAGTELVVNLTGVTNAQAMSFDLTDVVDERGDAVAPTSAQLGFLVGDVNNDRTVNSGDAFIVRRNSGNAATGTALASDINCDGFVNSGDTTIVRNASGTGF